MSALDPKGLEAALAVYKRNDAYPDEAIEACIRAYLEASQGQKPGEGAAQGTPADEQSGETSPAYLTPPKVQAEVVADVRQHKWAPIMDGTLCCQYCLVDHATHTDLVCDKAPLASPAPQAEAEGWTKKRRGTAIIYTHPHAYDGRAVVSNSWGVTFNGKQYDTVDDAKADALAAASTEGK